VSFQSRLLGVGQSTWAESFGSPLELTLPFARFAASSATGVCHSQAPRLFAAFLLPDPPSSAPPRAMGVGQNPDPLAPVGRSDIISSQHTPPCIIPQRGKVTADHGKSSSNKQR
jgi:hypothetical protein